MADALRRCPRPPVASTQADRTPPSGPLPAVRKHRRPAHGRRLALRTVRMALRRRPGLRPASPPRRRRLLHPLRPAREDRYEPPTATASRQHPPSGTAGFRTGWPVARAAAASRVRGGAGGRRVVHAQRRRPGAHRRAPAGRRSVAALRAVAEHRVAELTSAELARPPHAGQGVQNPAGGSEDGRHGRAQRRDERRRHVRTR